MGAMTLGLIAAGLNTSNLLPPATIVDEAISQWASSFSVEPVEVFEPYIPADDASPSSYASLSKTALPAESVWGTGERDTVEPLPEIPIEPDEPAGQAIENTEPAETVPEEPQEEISEQPAEDPVETGGVPAEPVWEELPASEESVLEQPVAEPPEEAPEAESTPEEQPVEEQPVEVEQPQEIETIPVEGLPPEQAKAPAPDWSWLTGRKLADMPFDERLSTIGEMAREDYRQTGVLASITAAQFICESGMMSGGSTLSNKYNNCFGIKASSSGYNWKDSTWKGKIATLKTQEEYKKGKLTTITADFRSYANVWESVQDHSAYLLNTLKDEENLRYPGIGKCRDPKKAIHIIKTGGYATSSTYESTILSIIKSYGLEQYDRL